MVISYQSSEGHTTTPELTDEEVRIKFAELTGKGFRAFASTDLDDPVGPIKTIEEVQALEPKPKELYFIAPLVGG